MRCAVCFYRAHVHARGQRFPVIRCSGKAYRAAACGHVFFGNLPGHPSVQVVQGKGHGPLRRQIEFYKYFSVQRPCLCTAGNPGSRRISRRNRRSLLIHGFELIIIPPNKLNSREQKLECPFEKIDFFRGWLFRASTGFPRREYPS